MLKAALRSALYYSGAVAALTRGVLANSLTIVLFHRILPAADPRSATADPEYTIDLTVFEDFADFLAHEYNPVSLQQVEAAVEGRNRLPARPLLVTFDDGWEDTARYAVPVLDARQIPSTIFVTTGGLTSEFVLWRDCAAILHRAGGLDAPGSTGIDNLYAWLSAMTEAERANEIASALAKSGTAVRPLMMTLEQLKDLPRSVAVGGHGVSHTPLTELRRADKELRDCRAMLTEATGIPPSAFAFPHGKYVASHLNDAYVAGFRLLFTSDAVLNTLADGRPASPALGRVCPAMHDLIDGSGRFSPSRAAFFLMRRNSMALDVQSGSRAA